MPLTHSSALPRPPLSTEQLAAYYTVTPRTIANWRAKGLIPYLRITARNFRYDLDQVERALAKGGR